MNEIYIYKDLGSSEFSVIELSSALQILFSNDFKIKTINANDILSGILFQNEQPYPRLLCFGGGYDLGYLQALGDEGCEQIRKYVEMGGCYLGICSGAYFAANYIEFDLNGPIEVKGFRKLKFFRGKCVGPVNKSFQYNSDDEAIAIQLEFCIENEVTKFHDYYYLNGGCAFLGSEIDFENCILLAKYKTIMENSAAIIACNYGRGKCLLSGVHIEFNANNLNKDSKNIKENLIDKLSKNNDETYKLLNYLINNYLFK